MRKSFEDIRSITRKATALSGVIGAVALPNVLAASANAAPAAKESLKHPIATRTLEKQATRDINAGRGFAWYNGRLVITQLVKTGGARTSDSTNGGSTSNEAGTSLVYKVYNRPLLKFRGNPKNQFGHDNLFSGDYALGQILDKKGGHPRAKLMVPDFMKNAALIPYDNGEPLVQSSRLPVGEDGRVNAFAPIAPNGVEQLDATGRPLEIAQGLGTFTDASQVFETAR